MVPAKATSLALRVSFSHCPRNTSTACPSSPHPWHHTGSGKPVGRNAPRYLQGDISTPPYVSVEGKAARGLCPASPDTRGA